MRRFDTTRINHKITIQNTTAYQERERQFASDHSGGHVRRNLGPMQIPISATGFTSLPTEVFTCRHSTTGSRSRKPPYRLPRLKSHADIPGIKRGHMCCCSDPTPGDRLPMGRELLPRLLQSRFFSFCSVAFQITASLLWQQSPSKSEKQ